MLRKWKKDKQGLWNIMWAYWTFCFDCDYRCPENPITSLTIVFSVYWTVFCIYFKYSRNLFILETFIFMHLADAFIQSDLQCIQAIYFVSVPGFVPIPGNRTHNLCAANAMLYHWATGTHDNNEQWNNDMN